MIAAMAQLPENDIRLELENLKEITDEMSFRTIPLLEYIDRVNVASEMLPGRFPPSIWNVYHQHVRRME